MEKMQEQVQQIVDKYNLQTSGAYRLLDVMSELGEVSKELLKMTNYGRSENTGQGNLAEELGDLLFSIITVANTYSIDLQTQLDVVIAKYRQRFETTGSVGSTGSTTDKEL